jgi:hypothetical protein
MEIPQAVRRALDNYLLKKLGRLPVDKIRPDALRRLNTCRSRLIRTSPDAGTGDCHYLFQEGFFGSD